MNKDRRGAWRSVALTLSIAISAVVLTELVIGLDLVPLLMLVPLAGWMILVVCGGAVMVTGMILAGKRPRYSMRTSLLVVLLIAWVVGRLNHEIAVERRRARAQKESVEQLLQMKPKLVSFIGRYTDGRNDHAIQVWLGRALSAYADPNVMPHEICYASEIDLSGSAIVDVNLSTLAGLGSIEVLDLSQTAVTDDGLKRLTALKSLGEIRVNGTAVSEEGLTRLRKRFPDLQWVR